MFRNLIEYKINFFSSILSETVYMIGIFIFFKIIHSNFDEVIPWAFEDFILYFLIYAVIITISGIFYWKEILFNLIKGLDKDKGVS